MDPQDRPERTEADVGRRQAPRSSPAAKRASTQRMKQSNGNARGGVARNGQGMTRASDATYTNVRGIMDTAVSRMGVENSRLAKQAYKQLDQTKKQWDKAEQNIREYIQKNPEKAAMIAAGVGVAIGAALAAMMKEK